MKLDNKGFAISGILYAVMILFLTIIFALLALISNRKLVLDKYKREVKEIINSSEETFGARVQFATNTSNLKISETDLVKLDENDFKSNVAGCLNTSTSGNRNVLCRANEVDITDNLAHRVYDELGNRVKFDVKTVTSTDDYVIKVLTYTYYNIDANGTYVLNPSNNDLSKTTSSLNPNKDNIFYVKYSVVDNNNILSKEVTRTLTVKKYNYYVNLLDNYFNISPNSISNFNFKTKANLYKYDGNNLYLSNNDLKSVIYSSNNEIITSWTTNNGKLQYVTSSGTHEAKSTDLFHVRYYAGEYNSPSAELKDAYFSVN